MTDAAYTGVPSHEITELLDGALADIGKEVDELRLPKLAAVVLGGGYGRGEGGVLHMPQGDRLYNDLDFFVFADGASRQETLAIQDGLKGISERWEKRLGVAVDFSPVKNVHSLCRVSQTLMYQELLRGWKPVWGTLELGDWIPALNAEKLPFSEAARLLLNRGMGLMFAAERLSGKKPDADFVMRNMNKAVLGCGDALLLASGRYRWHGEERVQSFKDYARQHAIPDETVARYERAFRYKLEPQPVLSEAPWEEWRNCRCLFLDAVRRVSGWEREASTTDICKGLRNAARDEWSLKNMLRWLLRAKSFRSLNELFLPPVVTVLEILLREMGVNDERTTCSSQLLALWKVFN
ncbi:MAG: hypothetical protein IJS08_10340 [Victivallales bacterium]|nr:hypothetical protein [Victivallales bacterium]